MFSSTAQELSSPVWEILDPPMVFLLLEIRIYFKLVLGDGTLMISQYSAVVRIANSCTKTVTRYFCEQTDRRTPWSISVGPCRMN